MDEGDQVVTDSLKNLKKKYGSAKVFTWSQIAANVGKIKKGDQFIILGHGSTSDIGHKSAREFAAAFAKADLPSGVIIDMVACNTGKGGSPLALTLKTELVSLKIVPAKVTGGTNLMYVYSDGVVRTGQEGQDARGNRQIDLTHKGKEKVQTPWGERSRNVDPTYRTGG
jgi:hypothetical protein